MRLPALEQAHALLSEGEALNPGPWVAHSRAAAHTAEALAAHLPGLDPGAAYILGLLHDIGRRKSGVPGARHILEGYDLLHERGDDAAARICLTHSFPLRDVRAYAGPWDSGEEDRAFVARYLAGVEYNDYDRLIQLCDALCLPSGPCLMEKRLVDVTMRYGPNEFTVVKWQAYLAIQRDFERILGRSIYTFLPGVVENTFGVGCSDLS